jgi:TIR domain
VTLISEIVSDPEVLVALEPEDVAGVLLEHLNSLTEGEIERLNRYNFTLPGADAFRGYPPQHREQIGRVIMEGWMWLERAGFIAPKPGTSGDWFFITRSGRQVKSREDLAARGHGRREMLPAKVVDAPTRAALEWDVFICHAGEDKAEVVEPLARALGERGVRVWYDRSVLRIGDSLRRTIDNGLSRSRYGVVVLSPSFFGKGWPERELDGLVQREVQGHKVILPVWHRVDHSAVAGYSLPLADKFAGSTNRGIEALAEEIAKAVTEANTSRNTALPDAPIEERWVDMNYPRDAGIVGQLEAAGYQVRWCVDGGLARALVIDGWEYVYQERDGRRAILRMRDLPQNQTLVKRPPST